MSRIITSALAVALLLVACGGGGGGAGPSTPTPTTRGTISLLAGSMQQAGSQDGVIQDGAGLQARLYMPKGVAQDAAGNIYVADTGNSTIRRIAPDGVVTTVAGAAFQYGSADGPGFAARFSGPEGIVAAANGDLYVADRANQVIRKISVTGDVATIAGMAGQYGAVDGIGTAARFADPHGLALDQAGNLLVADGSGAVRKVALDGTVTTFAGKLGEKGFAVGDGAQARFGIISGVAVDSNGVVHVSDYGTVETGGAVRRFDSQARALPWGAAPQGVVRIHVPNAIAVAPGGDIVVSSASVISRFSVPTNENSILRITPAGAVVLLAGSYPSATQSNINGSAVPSFNQLFGIAVLSDGRILVADSGNHAIRQIDRQNVVTTLAGGEGTGRLDGPGPSARFYYPQTIAAAPDGTLYVADGNNAQIRRVSLAGDVSTLTMTGDLNGGSAFSTLGQFVYGVAVASDGTRYVSYEAASGSSVAVIDSSGRLRQLAPNQPMLAMAASASGLYYTVSDRVEKLLPDGTQQVIASGFKWPRGVAVDASGTVYVSDFSDKTVRAIDSKGAVRLVAGKPGEASYVDGTADQAGFLGPTALALDNSGNVYVSDGNPNELNTAKTIRKIGTDGRVSTVAGTYGGVPSQNVTSPLPGALYWVQGLTWYAGMLYAVVGNAILAIGPLN